MIMFGFFHRKQPVKKHAATLNEQQRVKLCLTKKSFRI